ncbi:MAG: hypothetical protein ACLQVN_00675 [Bryobacteraceae bacterium]
MGQNQRRSWANVITNRAETGKAEKDAERRRQEGDQRSHEETLGVETGPSSEVAANCRKEGGVEEADSH